MYKKSAITVINEHVEKNDGTSGVKVEVLAAV